LRKEKEVKEIRKQTIKDLFLCFFCLSLLGVPFFIFMRSRERDIFPLYGESILFRVADFLLS
jgi:hypothetical protein